ncbi:hypothetical protein [Frigoriflavimonas asaccharolytica]|uniref:Uncharacterized protein n=1 Tax=Frigoriflavimonas asaccharolytica TaxID=2735899 RepID=A0A8J8G620_9FLAO|nr:hypothetical protein [Frigoriflavimonas asaccharolytica]NRS91385.1 hypothetical protein [Frigoriflavimonas asaccharolytica]
MNTLILHFNDNIAKKLKTVLATFSEKDLQVEEKKDQQFLQTKRELEEDYAYSQWPDAELYTIEDVKQHYNIVKKLRE